MQNYLFSVLTVAASLGLYRLFGKIMPVSKSKYFTNKTYAQLRMEYLGFDLRFIGLTVLLTVVLIYFFYQLLRVISDFRIGNVEDAGILIRPDIAFLLLPAFFDGMLVAAVLASALGKRHLKDKWGEFMAYYNLKYKFNYELAMGYVLRFVAILVIPLSVLVLDLFSSFGAQSIKLNGFMGFGTKTYNYEEVSGVTRVLKSKAPNGDIVNAPDTVITFKDGTEWSTRGDGSAEGGINPGIVDLVVVKTNQQIVEKEFAD